MEPHESVITSELETPPLHARKKLKSIKDKQMPLPGMHRGAENPWQTRSYGLHVEITKRGNSVSTLELCAGAGGQALGFEMAGFGHAALVEFDNNACATLRLNRPKWDVLEADLRAFDATPYRGIDVVSAGLPCPPFSVAGKQLGHKDDRNLFPSLIDIVERCHGD